MKSPPSDYAVGWRPQIPGVSEVFHARFTNHCYPPHVHQTWTILLVDVGSVRYDLEHHHRGSDATAVTILPPHVVHDGRSATADGFRKRVLYIDTSALPESLTGAAVDRPTIADVALIHDLSCLHAQLVDRDDLLAGEETFERIIDRIRWRLRRTSPTAPRHDPVAAARLRDVLDERPFEALSLASASEAIGVSARHASRSFTQTFGVSPHAYVVSRRVERARQLLLAGVSVADAALSAGFHDQPHLTRHFRRYVGTTPARYRASDNRFLSS